MEKINYFEILGKKLREHSKTFAFLGNQSINNQIAYRGNSRIFKLNG